MKKLLAIFLAMMLVLSMGVTAFATGDTDEGSITIYNATINEDYAAYKIFDATYGEGGAAYSIKTTSQFYEAVEDSGLFTLTPSAVDSTTCVVTLVEGTTDTAILNWLKGLSVASMTPDASMTASSTTVRFDDLSFGYYFVTTTLGVAVSVDNVHTDVTIIDKNQAPDWEDPDGPDGDQAPGKNVSADGTNYAATSTAGIGDTVHFKLNAYAPLFHGDKLVTKYIFTDTLADAFTYNNDLVVKANGSTLAEYTDYTVMFNDATNTLTIELDVNANAITGYAWATDTHLEFTYTAVLNAEATLDNLNTASMTWKELTPNPDDPTNPDDPDEVPDEPDTPPTDVTTHTYTYGFNLTKVDGTDTTKVLEGAEFKLYDAQTEDNQIKLVDITASVTNPAQDTNYYRVADATETTADATIVAGKAIIFGLDEGVYWLEEIAAPTGYNMLTERVSFQTGKEIEGEDEIPTYVDVAVENNTGTILPETGGIGTTIFYVLGGILVAGATVLLITKKRLSKQN